MNGGHSPRRKGDGIERELVELHRALGIYTERIRFRIPAGSAAPGMTWISTSMVATKRH